MIVAEGLTKRFGRKTAVNGVTFSVERGAVTGFLGPNGAGKSTTMRMIVGLDRPTSGRVTVDGKDYRDLRAPLTEVGTLFDAGAVHRGRSARNHLRALAATHGIPRARVEEVIELAGIQSVARTRAGRFSLGMRQRLGIAAALLGDPQALVLDEPVNGLDPEGVRWIRDLVRFAAGQGRAVLLSSHLMSEMAQTADRLIVVGRGTVLADMPLDELVDTWTTTSVRVRTPRPADLAGIVSGPGVEIVDVPGEGLHVVGLPAERISELAADHAVPIHELSTLTGSLEDAYLALTGDAVEFRSKEAA